MDELFSSLARDFVEETLPLAEEVGRLILKLEEVLQAGGDGQSLLRGMRSSLHTIKGNAAMMRIIPIEKLAHALEDLCLTVSNDANDRCSPSRQVQLLIEGSDLLATEIRRVLAGDVAPEDTDAMLRRFTDAGSSCVDSAKEPAGRAASERRSSYGQVGQGSAVADVDERRGGSHITDGEVDELLELAGETIVRQSKLSRAIGRLSCGEFEIGDLGLMDQTVTDLGRATREMRRRLLKVRLAPIGSLFGKFVRYVRDLAHERGQPIDLVIEGGEIAIDRAIIGRLFEPLVHIVRNAIAHGIESVDQRIALGKPAKATMLFRARLNEGRVDVHVADDGRGLDLRAISAKAQAQGIDTSGLDERDIQRLIFQAGFSTATSVSSLAGRGVGLDVVASVVQGLGGRVDVRSSKDQGTVFMLDLPVTLSLQKALVFGVDSEAFAIPTGFVLDTLKSDERDMQVINRVLLLSWRGDFVRAADAGRLLGCSGLLQEWTRPYAIVVRAGNKRGALLVDWLSGVQEIVVKPIDDVFAQCHLLAGMTVLAQGRVVPILDSLEIVRRTSHTLAPERISTRTTETDHLVF